MLLVSAYVQAADVLVFANQQTPIDAPDGVSVIHLDTASEIEAELASGLPADPQRAEVIVRQRLADGDTNLQAHLASAYQGVLDAWNLGITKLPAVVVEGRYVVYGDADVARAMATIEAYMRAHQ
ncbi:TIGR03757 family integrating conjugative element protein [Alloalcanivorax xenomutans]|uniref:TIGR03757 family integrating conjugative element protein n=1 Tax=Alloalcanivorax xenomutans TaxID=1094342 RepID=UPI0035A8D97C